MEGMRKGERESEGLKAEGDKANKRRQKTQ